MTFAEKFLKLRKQALLSQEEAAEKIGVSRQAISRWEQGTALPDAFNLSIICKVFGVSANYLINDDVTENAAENVSAAFNSDDDGASFIMVENSIPYGMDVCFGSCVRAGNFCDVDSRYVHNKHKRPALRYRYKFFV